jgi:NADPH-dependent curcumin reductase CurA
MSEQQQKNQEVIFASKPKDKPTPDNFKLQDCAYPQLSADGELLVKILYLSVDPYMRPKMTVEGSYTESYEVGKPMYGDAIAKVLESRNSNFRPGDLISGMLRWRKFDVIKANEIEKSCVNKLDTKGLDLPLNLSLLGMTGETAYLGLTRVGHPKKGQTILVSAAAGAVGSVVGQLAKDMGLTVIGLAGGPEKTKLVEEKFKFDKCIDYKRAGDKLDQAIKEACPQGVDLYWDNVGGPTLDAVLLNLNDRARIIMCGQISTYNNPVPVYNTFMIIAKRVSIEGFLVYDFYDQFEEARTKLAQLYKEKKIHYELTTEHGLENLVPSLLGLFEGKNVGKAIVEIAQE